MTGGFEGWWVVAADGGTGTGEGAAAGVVAGGAAPSSGIAAALADLAEVEAVHHPPKSRFWRKDEHSDRQ
jgi:hypothetical protein